MSGNQNKDYKLATIQYTNIAEFVAAINRNFAIIESSPLYKGLAGKSIKGNQGLSGLRGSQIFYFTKDRIKKTLSSQLRVAGISNKESISNLTLLNKIISDSNYRLVLTEILNVPNSNFIANDIIILPDNKLVSYDPEQNLFIDTETSLTTNVDGSVSPQLNRPSGGSGSSSTNNSNGTSSTSGGSGIFEELYVRAVATDPMHSPATAPTTGDNLVAFPSINDTDANVGKDFGKLNKFFSLVRSKVQPENKTEFITSTTLFGNVNCYRDLISESLSVNKDVISKAFSAPKFLPGFDVPNSENTVPVAVYLQNNDLTGILIGHKSARIFNDLAHIYKTQEALVLQSNYFPTHIPLNDYEAFNPKSMESRLSIHREFMEYNKLFRTYNLEVERGINFGGELNHKKLKIDVDNSNSVEIGEKDSISPGNKIDLKSSELFWQGGVTGEKKTNILTINQETGKVTVAELAKLSEPNEFQNSNENKNTYFDVPGMVDSTVLDLVIRKLNAINGQISDSLKSYYKITDWASGRPGIKLEADTVDVLKPTLKLGEKIIFQNITNPNSTKAIIDSAVRFGKYPNAVLTTKADGALSADYSINQAQITTEGLGNNTEADKFKILRLADLKNYYSIFNAGLSNLGDSFTENLKGVYSKDDWQKPGVKKTVNLGPTSIANLGNTNILAPGCSLNILSENGGYDTIFPGNTEFIPTFAKVNDKQLTCNFQSGLYTYPSDENNYLQFSKKLEFIGALPFEAGYDAKHKRLVTAEHLVPIYEWIRAIYKWFGFTDHTSLYTDLLRGKTLGNYDGFQLEEGRNAINANHIYFNKEAFRKGKLPRSCFGEGMRIFGGDFNPFEIVASDWDRQETNPFDTKYDSKVVATVSRGHFTVRNGLKFLDYQTNTEVSNTFRATTFLGITEDSKVLKSPLYLLNMTDDRTFARNFPSTIDAGLPIKPVNNPNFKLPGGSTRERFFYPGRYFGNESFMQFEKNKINSTISCEVFGRLLDDLEELRRRVIITPTVFEKLGDSTPVGTVRMMSPICPSNDINDRQNYNILQKGWALCDGRTYYAWTDPEVTGEASANLVPDKTYSTPDMRNAFVQGINFENAGELLNVITGNADGSYDLDGQQLVDDSEGSAISKLFYDKNLDNVIDFQLANPMTRPEDRVLSKIFGGYYNARVEWENKQRLRSMVENKILMLSTQIPHHIHNLTVKTKTGLEQDFESISSSKKKDIEELREIIDPWYFEEYSITEKNIDKLYGLTSSYNLENLCDRASSEVKLRKYTSLYDGLLQHYGLPRWFSGFGSGNSFEPGIATVLQLRSVGDRSDYFNMIAAVPPKGRNTEMLVAGSGTPGYWINAYNFIGYENDTEKGKMFGVWNAYKNDPKGKIINMHNTVKIREYRYFDGLPNQTGRIGDLLIMGRTDQFKTIATKDLGQRKNYELRATNTTFFQNINIRPDDNGNGVEFTNVFDRDFSDSEDLLRALKKQVRKVVNSSIQDQWGIVSIRKRVKRPVHNIEQEEVYYHKHPLLQQEGIRYPGIQLFDVYLKSFKCVYIIKCSDEYQISSSQNQVTMI